MIERLRYLLRPQVRWWLSWFCALVALGVLIEQAWTSFDVPDEHGGVRRNWGHAAIDFGGQWLMGRTIAEGHGRNLYNRNYHRPILEANYPPGPEIPDTHKSDAENLLGWLMGQDDPEAVASFLTPLAAPDALSQALLLTACRDEWTEKRLENVIDPHRGGALYPPIHAIFYAPLGALPPPIAYRVLQTLLLISLFVNGWLIERVTQGGVWQPVAVLLLAMVPGVGGSINLAQNGLLSLTLVMLGWWQLTRHRPIAAGVWWGLLAYKPVWAAAFLLVPLLLRRWRMVASMVLTGLAQIVLTLPIVGWHSWLQWLRIGRDAAHNYTVHENWIFLSRDLLGIARRWMLTFADGSAIEPTEQFWPTMIGWTLWAAVLAVTLWIGWRGGRHANELAGPSVAFVLLGAFFFCFHFMYYDFVLSALPILLLLAELGRDFRAERRYWVRATMPLLLIFLVFLLPAIGYLYLCDSKGYYPPGETFCLLGLWAWCGFQSSRDREGAGQEPLAPVRGSEAHGSVVLGNGASQFPELGPDVPSAHERLANERGADAGRL